MSISTFQEKFIKGGCGKAIIIFSAVAMAFGLGFSNCSKAARLTASDVQGRPETVLASVGGVDISVGMLERSINESLAATSQGMTLESFEKSPPTYAQIISSGVNQLIQKAQLYDLAKKEGFNDDDNSVLKAMHMDSEASFKKFAVDSLRSIGQLKPNSTDKDLDDYTKSRAGNDFQTLYQKKHDDLVAELKDNQKRIGQVLNAGQQFYVEKIRQGMNPNDDEIKKQFDSDIVKRVLVRIDAKVTAEQAKAKADKAYADLKAGKSFEDVMDAYSEEAPAVGKKKKSENQMSLPASVLDQYPDFKIISTLQPGGYTDPQKTGEGYVIYKLVEKKLELPKDYDTSKDKYKQNYINSQLETKLKETLDAADKTDKPTFQLKAYEAAYRFAKASANPQTPPDVKTLLEVYDIAKGVQPGDAQTNLAAIIAFQAIDTAYNMPSADKAKLKPMRMEAMANYLVQNDSMPLRMELIDYYKELKQGDKAYEQLTTVFDKDATYDAAGQQAFSDISAKFLELKNANLIKPDQEKEFRSKQEQWKIDKKKFDDQQAEQKKQDDAAKKKADEEAKKNKSAAGSNKPESSTGNSFAPKQ